MKLLTALFLAFGIALLTGCVTHTTKPTNKPVIATDYLDKGFTPWMRDAELHAYFAPLDAKDSAGKNYWDRKHWMTAVQGRWHDGGPQFRFKLSSAPTDHPYVWYWYFNMDKEVYTTA